jgi:dihydrofolate reductase
VVNDDAAAFVAQLKQQGSQNVFVFGSAQLCATLLEAGLVDEVRVCLIPMVLGAGRPLFPDGMAKKHFHLLETVPLGHGCVVLRYGQG